MTVFLKKRGSIMSCERCEAIVVRRGAMQRYCLPCSDEKSAERTRAASPDDHAKHKSVVVARGKAISKDHTQTSLIECFDSNESAAGGWMVGFKMPFSAATSKNHVYSLARGTGHVFKRQESRSYQNALAIKVQEATKSLKVYQNKIWIDLFVQKPHHRGDAINVIDVVCDGLKVGLGIDDRWFCIRRVDWEIAKNDPQIFIRVYQHDVFDALACSHCGRILALDNFGKKKSAKMGVHRVCNDCRYGPNSRHLKCETAGAE